MGVLCFFVMELYLLLIFWGKLVFRGLFRDISISLYKRVTSATISYPCVLSTGTLLAMPREIYSTNLVEICFHSSTSEPW